VYGQYAILNDALNIDHYSIVDTQWVFLLQVLRRDAMGDDDS